MVNALEQVQICSPFLQRERCTLGEADRALELLLGWLQAHATGSPFAKYLFASVVHRVGQRRTLIYSLARFGDEAAFETSIEGLLATNRLYSSTPRTTRG